mgnify:CR=1 FL=1
MRAIILAAGEAVRFNNEVKPLLQINSETIIGRLVRQLKSANVNPIYVVVGHKAEKFLDVPGIVIINYPFYQARDNAQGLKMALDLIGFEDTLMIGESILIHS